MTRAMIDLTGEICPVPLLRTREELALMPSGGLLQVETDFARSVRNITQWCAREGYPFEYDEIEPGLWRITITKY